MKSPLAKKPGGIPRSILDRADFPFPSLTLCSLPKRFRGEKADANPAFEEHLIERDVDEAELEFVPSPASELSSLASREDIGPKVTDDALKKLFQAFLLAEDPHRRLDQGDIQPLAHQVSLIEHIKKNQPDLSRVLIADEVGLGKTIEAALIIEHFLSSLQGAKVLYLTPARLVPGATRELNRLGRRFRAWMSDLKRPEDILPGTPKDGLLVASIHRASLDQYIDSIASERWQMLIVDECHHLSAWEADGGKPTQKYKLVEEIISKLEEPRRVILLSGTPHQGNVHRFDNLLRLLDQDFKKNPEKIKGKVVYRLKEDIKNWDDQPLFPSREVRTPSVIDLGPELQEWFRMIFAAFAPDSEEGDSDWDQTHRAQTWRQAQAMQWAASSVEAGLAYLVRQGVRAGMTTRDSVFAESLAAIRPYRGGSPQESINDLFARIKQQIGVKDFESLEFEDDEDENEIYAEKFSPNRAAFEDALKLGIKLAKGPQAKKKWEFLFETVMADIGNEKAVLFAQPIETVLAFKNYAEQLTGKKCAIIVGGQDIRTREQEIDHFRENSAYQFLVSSKAGGEGINLQNARRLIHLDVPWNPMEMEQRVGRVHRFGSTETILVDTLVAKDSREAHMYKAAREKLSLIASTLGGGPRAETIFGRVMALIPPVDLNKVILSQPYGPFDDDDTTSLFSLIDTGFKAWRSFHEEYANILRHNSKPGEATWTDVESFAASALGALKVDGFTIPRFSRLDGKTVSTSTFVPAYSFKGSCRSIGDCGGFKARNSAAEEAPVIGLNDKIFINFLRDLISNGSSAGFLRFKTGQNLSSYQELIPALKSPCILLSFICLKIRSNPGVVGGYEEEGTKLRTYLLNASDGSQVRELKDKEFSSLLRDILPSPSFLRRPKLASDASEAIKRAELEIIRSIMTEKLDGRARNAVFPWTAIGIETE